MAASTQSQWVGWLGCKKLLERMPGPDAESGEVVLQYSVFGLNFSGRAEGIAEVIRETTQLSTRMVPYKVPQSGIMCANSLWMLLVLSVVGVYFLPGVGMAVTLAVAAGACAINFGARFFLLQAPAFEVWHGNRLVFSGLDSWRTPHHDDLDKIFADLEKHGVAVARPNASLEFVEVVADVRRSVLTGDGNWGSARRTVNET
eukprot:CAMPEP_0115534078 /NCGR_PEP_ID=MMETSP0271-20121206/86472_1 /TAXON_ID=71861 /ORGANISM="Scrippsiella trochoidea, Strain CCMP3099" /LENGTH=201 /DNA_ID=CAMNT_0002966521 /DNA_START=12 /DNA_END=614 /DNA_ORIENTATION=+